MSLIKSLPISYAAQRRAEDSGVLPIAAKIALAARTTPDQLALTFCAQDGAETDLTWAQFDAATNRIARLFDAHGLASDGALVVALPNSIEHLIATFAAWKLGAMVIPLDPSLPAARAAGIFDQLTREVVLVADSEAISTAARKSAVVGSVCSRSDIRESELSSDPVEIVTPNPGVAFTSGGSTGLPRVVIKSFPLTVSIRGVFEVVGLRDGEYVGLGVRPSDIQLVAGPLFHGGPFVPATLVGLASGQRIILMERFDAEMAVDLIERHRVNFAYLVPTMMRRILNLPHFSDRDFSSIEMIYHGAAVCPQNVKQGWIDLVGPQHIIEVYSSTEGIGQCIIRGDEWLEHPGSVGRPVGCEVLILDEEGHVCKHEQIGEIFMREHAQDAPSASYGPQARVEEIQQGAVAQTAVDMGFRSVGDLGHLDKDGYLYIADRRSDLIICGGANVYPAAVESVIARHPQVSDVVVVGVPDADLGQRVHAIVELVSGSTLTSAQLIEFSRDNLAREQRPRSCEFVDELPRNEAGKLRRSALNA